MPMWTSFCEDLFKKRFGCFIARIVAKREVILYRNKRLCTKSLQNSSYKRTCKIAILFFPFVLRSHLKAKDGELIFNTSSQVRLFLQIWRNCLELHTLLKKEFLLKCLYPTLQSAPVTTRQGKTAPNWAEVGRRIDLLLLNFSSQEHTMKKLILKKAFNIWKVVMVAKTKTKTIFLFCRGA